MRGAADEPVPRPIQDPRAAADGPCM